MDVEGHVHQYLPIDREDDGRRERQEVAGNEEELIERTKREQCNIKKDQMNPQLCHLLEIYLVRVTHLHNGLQNLEQLV